MDYNSINAKIRAMKGRLINYSQYERLISLGSIEEIANQLRLYKSYKDVIEVMPTDITYKRGLIEQKISIANIRDYNKIYNFIGNYNSRKYLSIIGLQHKIKILKLIIGAIYDEREINLDKDYYKLDEYFGFNLEKLETSKSIRELIDNLKDTEFYDVLVTVYKHNTNLFDFNMRLDLYYYTRMYKLQNKYLDKYNKKILLKLNGVEVDMQNIMLIYRLKTYYNINPDFIYTYLIPYNYKISNKQLKLMVESVTLEDLQVEILKTEYKKYFQQENNIDKVYRIVKLTAYKKATSLHRNSIAQVISYLYLKEIEVNNLISLIEGVRYKLSSEEIFKFINIY